MIGDSHSQLLFPFIKDHLGLNYLDVISNPGWGIKKFMSRGIIQNLPDADVAVVSLGGNNHNMDMNSYATEIHEFIDLLQTKFKRIVWIGPFYSDDKDVNFRHARTNILLKLELPISVGYIDTYDLSQSFERYDKVHFNRDGYKELVSQIQGKVKTLIYAISPRVWISHPKMLIPFGVAITMFSFGIFGASRG
jgi:hypothetical protein